jgi:serine/threonine-protein kinase
VDVDHAAGRSIPPPSSEKLTTRQPALGAPPPSAPTSTEKPTTPLQPPPSAPTSTEKPTAVVQQRPVDEVPSTEKPTAIVQPLPDDAPTELPTPLRPTPPPDVQMASPAPSSLPGQGRASSPSLPDATALTSLADPLIGIVVADRYRILAPLGRGGMGIVYKVEHTSLGKLLAMKLLAGDLSRDPEIVRRFKREALTVSKLYSPNTVQVFDYGVADGLTYLVMELVGGSDLGSLLAQRKSLPFVRVGKLCIQVLSSLAEAHALGIVHRDIKPANVMVTSTPDGMELTKVLDFGIAKLREEKDASELTGTDQIIGTPYFMAPEQLLGGPVDPRADLYAVGVLLYRALTGHYPFSGQKSVEVMAKHLNEAPNPPSKRAPGQNIPPGVDALVLKALAKDPAQRWQRAEDMQAALVAELRALGAASVDDLLDAEAIRRLSSEARGAAGAVLDKAGKPAQIASRDDVESYERKLKKRRYGVVLLLLAAVAGGGFFGGRALMHRKPAFTGAEHEPNDTGATATEVPFGTPIVGTLGKRLDAGRSDRDMYAFELPAQAPGEPSYLNLQLTVLPHTPMCAMLYKRGFPSPIAQYCVGIAGRDLKIPALKLEPGNYLVGLLQDMDSRGAMAAPFVHEHISDTYTLRVSRAEPEPGTEVEPNDDVAGAVTIVPGTSASATIGWADDQDIFCVDPGASSRGIRWVVKDVVRDAGAVLEVTPMRGRTADTPILVHVQGEGVENEFDKRSPWTSPVIPGGSTEARCLRARLSRDPWMPGHEMRPPGAYEMYVVEVQASD